MTLPSSRELVDRIVRTVLAWNPDSPRDHYQELAWLLVARIRELEQFKEWAEPQIVTYGADQERIRELKTALRGLLAEVEYVITSECIPRTWLDMNQPDLAIVNARSALDRGDEYG